MSLLQLCMKRTTKTIFVFLRVAFNGNHLLIFIYDRNHDILEGAKYAFIDIYHSFCLMHLKDMVKGVSSSYQ